MRRSLADCSAGLVVVILICSGGLAQIKEMPHFIPIPGPNPVLKPPSRSRIGEIEKLVNLFREMVDEEGSVIGRPGTALFRKIWTVGDDDNVS